MIREATYKPLRGIRIWVKSGEASFAKFLNFSDSFKVYEIIVKVQHLQFYILPN